MTWSYRVVRHRSEMGDDVVEHYALHEITYGEDGKPTAMSENPVTFVGETGEEVIEELLKASRDAQSMDAFVPPKEWREG